MNSRTTRTPIVRKRSRGANLAMLCAMAVMILGFMGIAIFTGLQAFVESDLQRASMNAALAGAAAYYSDTESTGRPKANPDNAKAVATSTFNAIASASSLGGFGATVTSVTNNDNNDSITVNTKTNLDTPLLAPLGINTIENTATATARALRYEPTLMMMGGGLKLAPVAGDIGSYSRVLDLTFPLVDGPGNDMYIEQDPAFQRGYVVEACNKTECYNLTPKATLVGSSKLVTVNGIPTIYGTAVFDLTKSGVRKASKIRITYANPATFDFYTNGAPAGTLTAADKDKPFITRIMLFGYSSTCVKSDTCPIPAGFIPVE